jgi:hypothetical protein
VSRTTQALIAGLAIVLAGSAFHAHEPDWQTHATPYLSVDTPTSWTASPPDRWGRVRIVAPDDKATLLVGVYEQGKWGGAERRLQSTSRGSVRRQINGATWKESRHAVEGSLQATLITLHDGRLVEFVATYAKGYQAQIDRVMDSLVLPSPGVRAVERLMQAYNAHDVSGMAATVTDDVGWYEVEGASMSVEVQGKASLLEGMAAHFRAIPSARSKIEFAEPSGRYVVVRERAHWIGPDGSARTRSSLSIYEIRDGLVAAVWYFPWEP